MWVFLRTQSRAPEPTVFGTPSTLKFIERLFQSADASLGQYAFDTATLGGELRRAPERTTASHQPPRDADPRLRVFDAEFEPGSGALTGPVSFDPVGAPSVVMVSTKRTKLGPLAYFLIRGLFRYFKRIPSTRRVAGTAIH
jgi:hypothetical protein